MTLYPGHSSFSKDFTLDTMDSSPYNGVMSKVCECCLAAIPPYPNVLCDSCWIYAQREGELKKSALREIGELSEDDIELLIRVLDAVRGFKRHLDRIDKEESTCKSD